jgi:CubicO group peptidase (beta-lactamase class C family)
MAQTGSPMSIEDIEALLLDRTETDAVPGLSVSVVKGDRLVWAKGFGFADLATAHPAFQGGVAARRGGSSTG